MTSERPREATWRAHFPAQCPPHGSYFLTVKSTVLRRAPCLVSCSAVPLLKFLIIFEQRTPHFHFALGLAKYLVLFYSRQYTHSLGGLGDSNSSEELRAL